MQAVVASAYFIDEKRMDSSNGYNSANKVSISHVVFVSV